MQPRLRLAAPILVLAPFVATVHADITLSAGLIFAEQGGTIDVGNLGTAGTAFAKDLIGGTGVGPHVIANLNNGTFGNSSSWIGNSDPSYGGIGFGAAQSIASFAFGRSNVTTGDPCAGGVCTDRSEGMYLIEFTNDANPVANHATATWSSIGSMTITNGGGVASWLRHRFNLNTPVSATGFRIITPGGAAIDEIELYSTPGALVPLPLGLVTVAAPGYSISWDGNDGDNFNAAAVPSNIALASNGSAAIGSGSLGPQIGVPFHVIANLNDGLYGNSNSWIGGDGDPAPFHAGVMFNGLYDVTSMAWGRDNGGEATQFTDRNLGTYTIERTLDGTSWESIGTVSYNFSEDGVVGGDFTPALRHEFELSDGDGGVLARGLRLLVPGTGIGAQGTAIDEIEVYGTLIPEPATAGLAALGAAFVLRRRRV
jgi:PEP-CTERM motif